ncbi:hypothetical protein E2C01_063520 [Portunus trituberculatus]|uniref:Uncharacterized protein n=1 Tax=Portunus trituberculatus TaxID=210409 RepID=A0A5B7HHU7_PORTR|nr:hypothetical protein [Portunus trituberculatus]
MCPVIASLSPRTPAFPPLPSAISLPRASPPSLPPSHPPFPSPAQRTPATPALPSPHLALSTGTLWLPLPVTAVSFPCSPQAPSDM